MTVTGAYFLLLHHGGDDPEPKTKPHDLYRDPLPRETARCRPLIESVRRRVSELLQDWPEHPTLLTVSKDWNDLEQNEKFACFDVLENNENLEPLLSS